MNASEFNAAVGHAITHAINEGVAKKTISVPEIIGIMEMHQGELMRWSQDSARLQAKQPPIILPATILPPGRNGN